MKIIREIFRPEPQVLYLEPVFGCNYRCPFCIHAGAGKIGPVCLGPELFEKLKPVIAKVRRIHITGLGEPFLNPYLLEYLSYFKQLGRPYYINSNGSLIEDAHIDIMAASQSELSISLDAGDGQTYASVRPGGNWQKVVSCLQRVSQFKASRASIHPLLYLTLHINALNVKSLKNIPDLAARLGVDAVKLSWTRLPQAHRNYSVFRDQAAVAEIIRDVSMQLRNSGIQVSNEAEFRRHVRGCWVFSPMLFVGANGTVTACCNRWLAIGDLNQNCLRDIWNGMPRRRLALAIVNGSPEQACQPCPQVRGVDYEKNEEDFFKPHDQDRTILAEKSKSTGRLPSLEGLDSAFRCGVDALLGNNLQTAVEIFSGLQTGFPDYFEIANNLAAAHYYLGNIDKCRLILHSIAELPHNQTILQSNLKSVT